MVPSCPERSHEHDPYGNASLTYKVNKDDWMATPR